MNPTKPTIDVSVPTVSTDNNPVATTKETLPIDNNPNAQYREVVNALAQSKRITLSVEYCTDAAREDEVGSWHVYTTVLCAPTEESVLEVCEMAARHTTSQVVRVVRQQDSKRVTVATLRIEGTKKLELNAKLLLEQ